ncbi:hypothetical protein ACMHYO_08730 [Allopusillimonas ginsengisoli]|uniref:hypothetical protein n=1 Tax=Allopusillimonas ginsengisoli TaxID=453575 RepID=UPI0010C17A79|nr:hypothetical protein D7I39_20435 [Allopusillimonas ginsengisoli]
MKILHKTLLCSALITVPVFAVQAHDNDAAHRAWIQAQKIDVQPTITIKESEIPADSGTGASAPGAYSQPVTPGAQSYGAQPSQPAQSGYTTPGTSNQQPMPGGSAPIEDHPGMQHQGGMRTQ